MFGLLPTFTAPYSAPSWTPADLDPADLRTWIRPETPKYSDFVGTLAAPGDTVARLFEEGGAGHAYLNSSGPSARPELLVNGGLRFSGAQWLACFGGIDAWDSDFALLAVANVRSDVATNRNRLLEVDFVTGYALTTNTSDDEIKSAIAAPAPPFGLITGFGTFAVRSALDSRIDTAHELSIDGAAPATETVTSGPLTDGPVYLGTAASAVGDPLYGLEGDLFEIVVLRNATPTLCAKLAAYAAARLAAGVYS